MNSTVKTVVFWLVIVLSAFLLWQVVKAGSTGQKEKEVNFSQFMTDVDQGNVREVEIIGMEVRGKYRNDNSGVHTTVPANYPDMIKTRSPRYQQRQLAYLASESGATCSPCGTVVFHDPPNADRGKQGIVIR